MDYKEIFTSLFLWLKEREARNGGVFTREELAAGFQFKGQTITLVGPTGIWIPKGFNVPISITTTSTNPYDDGFADDGILNYRYRGTNPQHRDNRALREAFRRHSPLVYFHSIKPGKYLAAYPIMIINDFPQLLTIEAAIDPAFYVQHQISYGSPLFADSKESVFSIRRYLTSVTKIRLHQSAFREFVLDAYDRRCTICRLRHPELLDAAHIIPDSADGGEPVVQNGLALCKIHHSAYDQNIIGITPDYNLRVREDVLEEIDGPMLEYGLKALQGQTITLPRNRKDHPDRERLARRFEEFRKAM